MIFHVVTSFRPFWRARHTLATGRNGQQHACRLGGTGPGTNGRHEESDYFADLPFWNITVQNAVRQNSLWLKGDYTQNRVVGELVMLQLLSSWEQDPGTESHSRLPSLLSARPK